MKACVSCGSTFATPSWTCPDCGYAPVAQDGYLSFENVTLDGYDADLFEQLAEVEGDSFWFRGRRRLIAWALERYFPGAESLLEVGCGTGYVLNALRASHPQLDLAGAELFPEGLAVARRRLADVPLFQLDARRMPFDREYDVVAALDVLEHVDDDTAAIAGLYRAVRPHGGAIVTVPQHPSLWSPADEVSQHVRRYTRRALVERIVAAGFEILRATSFVSLLLPVMVLQRALARRRAATYSLTAELSATRRLTAILDGVMTLERGLVRAGTSLPAGGSLLVVARRPS